MKNKILLIYFVLIILMLSGCSAKTKGENAEKANSKFCADCGQGGWKKMDDKCTKKISNKNDFKNCLKEFNWSSVDKNTDLEKFEEGFIEMGGMELMDNPTANSIKVFNYRQWSVDENGQLYLLGQLG